MDKDAAFHRTFAMANAVAATPELTTQDMRWMPFEMQKKRADAAAYRKAARAFTAYQLVGNRLKWVWLAPKVGQNFVLYATVWELTYAQNPMGLAWLPRCEAVVDENLTVVGYIGKWSSVNEILIPTGCSPTPDLDSLLDQGVPVFATSSNPMPDHYRTNDFAGTNSGSFLLLVGPDGSVVKVLEYHGERGLEPVLDWRQILEIANFALEVWAAIETGMVIGEFAASVRAVGVRALIRGLVRAGATRLRMIPGLRKAAAQAAAKETRQLATVNVGRFGTPGHLLASLEVENGRVVYVIRSIHLRGERSAAELEAREAHLGMLKRAANEAQARGDAEFTVRGIDAGPNFQQRFGKELAERIGKKGSAKLLPSSSGGKTLEVTFIGRKVLDYIAKEAKKLELAVE